ncbi:MAG TPA: polyphenol oxidase family protein [Phycisphaerae bacterium]|nr:polyphenol oxidase family protein [Phycisphaerae bacterium]
MVPPTTCTVELQSTALEDSRVFQFPALLDVPGFRHAVTSRPWNMATHCGPDTDKAPARRRKVCDFLELPFENLTAADQIHSPHVIRVRESDIGAGRDGRHSALKFIDGMICDIPNVPLMQFSADCPLLLLIEPRRRLFGMCHASWRGTVAEISVELVRQLRKEFSVDPAALVGGLCPCAGPLEYEVGEDVRRIALARLPEAERFFPKVRGGWRFDLRAANLDQLARSGVDPAAISVASICTLSDERFYSFRCEGEKAGRFALVAGFHGR